MNGNFFNSGQHQAKADCHADYANCDMFVVLVPFQILI